MWGTPESSRWAHLHLQVYPDHQFDRAELLNPYGLLVQLCNGKGVTDLNHPPWPASGFRRRTSRLMDR